MALPQPHKCCFWYSVKFMILFQVQRCLYGYWTWSTGLHTGQAGIVSMQCCMHAQLLLRGWVNPRIRDGQNLSNIHSIKWMESSREVSIPWGVEVQARIRGSSPQSNIHLTEPHTFWLVLFPFPHFPFLAAQQSASRGGPKLQPAGKQEMQI